jgi:hypothetical protein
MMVLTERFTPETFLSLPRRGVIDPNANGTLGLYSVSTHESGKGTKKEWRVMELASGKSFQLTDDEKVHDVKWVPGSDKTVIWLRSVEGGITKVIITHLADGGLDGEPEHVGSIEGPVEALKLKTVDDCSIAVAVVGLADSEGGIYNPEDEKNRQLSTARIYDDIIVREVCSDPTAAVCA